MGVQEVLKRKTGVIVGDDVYALFKYAQKHEFAIPAINVTSSSTVVASLEAARDAKAPIILQMSQGGAAYFAGKGVKNGDQQASIAGAVAAAHFIRSVAPSYEIPVVLHTDHCAKKLLPWLDGMLEHDEKHFKEHGEPLFSSHMIDLSEESVDYNIETTAKYLKRAAPMKQWLEMEIGITGGEEDGVNNEDVDNNSLYTQPEDIHNIYKTLSPISPYFSIAAGFGNVHGVYKPGNVKLHPELLNKHQNYVKDQESLKDDKPVFLVFHGGSGSSKQEYKNAISYGVVKVNLDTDLQYAYLTGIRDYVLNKKDYVMTQVGNPDGEDKPNKKFYDPRVWVREGEKTMSARVAEGLKDFNTAGQTEQIQTTAHDLKGATATSEASHQASTEAGVEVLFKNSSQPCSPRLLSIVLVIGIPLAMLFINACYFFMFEWHLLYTLTLSSPLTPSEPFDLSLPTNNSLNLPLNLSSPLNSNVSQRPPDDPYSLRLRGSPTYVAFTNYGESIPDPVIAVIFSRMDNDLRAHLPQDRHVSMSFVEREYTGWGAKLTLETGFVGDITWGQWKNASGALHELYKRFGGFEFEFDVFTNSKRFLASGAMTLTD